MKNSKWKLYRALLILILIFSINSLIRICYKYLDEKIPSVIYVKEGAESFFDIGIPATAKVISVSSSGTSNIPPGSIDIDLSKQSVLSTAANADAGSSIKLIVKLFGIIPVKQTSVRVMDDTEVIPMGIPVGIYVETEGVMVVGTGEIVDTDNNHIKPASNYLKSGDYIKFINGQPITTKDQVTKAVFESQGRELSFVIDRAGEELIEKIVPVMDKSGEYKIGVWLRDNTQGIGTLTYLDGKGGFAALGHGISDVDTGLLMDMSGGKIYKSDIVDIKKGKVDNPGELVGMIVYSSDQILGEIEKNTEKGIFGSLSGQEEVSLLDAYSSTDNYSSINTLYGQSFEPVSIAYKQEILKGSAKILCTVEDAPKYYDIKITNIHMDEKDINHQIEIEIVDKDLISLTGGIVQGMSGAPIIQNGKLIGAVTHVLVNNPRKGYGIFIEEMLEE